MMMTVITTNTIFIICVILMDDGGTKALQLHREAKAEAETHFERDETNTHFQDTIPTHTRHYLQPYNPTHAAETSYY